MSEQAHHIAANRGVQLEHLPFCVSQPTLEAFNLNGPLAFQITGREINPNHTRSHSGDSRPVGDDLNSLHSRSPENAESMSVKGEFLPFAQLAWSIFSDLAGGAG